jgi:hypothetical protein
MLQHVHVSALLIVRVNDDAGALTHAIKAISQVSRGGCAG